MVMKKTTLNILAIFGILSATYAQEWQYTTSGGGYSYDENGIYTDSKGFTVFESNTWDGLDWSGKNSGVDAKDSSGRNPVKYPGSLAFSALTIVESTIKNSDFSNSTYFGNSNYSSLSTLLVNSDATLENVDFSGSSFSHKAENPSGYEFVALYLLGTVKNANFSNVEISETSSVGYGIRFGGLVGGSNVTENINLSSAKITMTNSTVGVGIDFNRDVKNINIDNIEINSSNGFALYSEWNVIDGLSAKDAKFTVREDLPYVWADSERNTFKDTDFRGATVNGRFFSAEDISSTGTNINTLLGNGEIFSNDNGSSVNKGLVLASGETFTISAHENSAKLTVDSEISGGTIEILNGGVFEISDGVSLTISDETSIVFEAGESINGIEDILKLGTDATIVMSGYETDEAAQAAFIGLFKDSNGNGVEWSLDSVASSVVGSGSIPEPSTCAAIFGALALVFAAYRRRK